MRRRLIVLAMLVSACVGTTATSGPARVELSEFAISTSGVFEPGPTSLIVANSGEFAHTLVIANAFGRVVAASDVIPPGREIGFSVDLEPGDYQLSCRIVVETGDGRLVDHYAEGMLTDISVGPEG
jgi:hypothetical protein